MFFDDDIVGEGEAHAGAFIRFGGQVGGKEFGEGIGRDAGAVIADFDFDVRVDAVGREGDSGRVVGGGFFFLLVRVVAGVVDDIVDDASYVFSDEGDFAEVVVPVSL